MKYPICIFEDNQSMNLFPLTLTIPVFDLRCGILSFREKVVKQFPQHPIILFCRDYLKELVEEANPDVPVNSIPDTDICLFINARVILNSELSNIFKFSDERVYLHNKQVIAAFLKKENISEFVKKFKQGADLGLDDVEQVEINNANVIRYPWDIVHYNPSEIVRDFEGFNQGGEINGTISQHAVLENQNNIFIGAGASVKAGVILDAEEGPIYIGEDATIMHHAVIEGPAFIGRKSTIKIAAKIYEGTSIGDVCKVGGEVEESIIHAYSNKQHDGFLGHAYLGQWVNLGADTNNSDLKNNYGNVKVYINGKMVDSNSMFVGLTMGDHSKAGINTMFNTGTVVGAMCNVFGSGFPPKYIPSFSWGGSDGLVEHNLDKAVATARQVMGRRKKELTPVYETLLREIYELTQNEREQFISRV